MPYIDMPIDSNELYFCRIVAAMRNDPKADARLQSSRLLGSHASTYDVHVIGMCGEYVVAKYCGILPSLHISMSGDGAVEDLIINGYTVQVKTCNKVGRDYPLLSTNPNDFNTDCGILVYRVNERAYRIQGVISQRKFREVAVVKDYGYGSRLVAEPQHFSSIDLLLNRPAPSVAVAGVNASDIRWS